MEISLLEAIILAVIAIIVFMFLSKAWGYFTTLGRYQARDYLKRKKEDKDENGRGIGKTTTPKTGGRAEGK